MSFCPLPEGWRDGLPNVLVSLVMMRCTPKFTELIAFTPTYFMTKFLDFVTTLDQQSGRNRYRR
eukprot:380074-Amphidinium_carterae.1